MAFETRKIFRPPSGAELKDILPNRIREAMLLDNTVNAARSFPLFRYRIKIELIPYHLEGTEIVQDMPGNWIRYEVDGEQWVPAFESAVDLVEESPVSGRDADPQKLREENGLGSIEKSRSELGEAVDVRMKPKPEASKPWTPDPVLDVPAPPDPTESEEQTYRAEQARWAAGQQQQRDHQVDAAVAQLNPSLAPGRVSIIRSHIEGGGADHGRGRR